MAKVNLGRIRTVFKGEWVAGAYEVDDVVLYAGSSYTCISNSTSSDDPTDTAFWVQSAGGLEFTGTWDTSTTYKVNQIATFNGSTYIAITAHSATQPTSTGQTDWAVIAEAFKFEGAWDVSTTYQTNDIATFSGSTYIALVDHTGTEPEVGGNASWAVFAGGFQYEGAWDVSIAYHVNDIVAFNGSSYIAIVAHTGTQPTSTGQTDWATIAESFKFEGAWDISTAYHTNDITTFSGSTYISLVDHTGVQPLISGNASWAVFAGGFQFEGAWDISTAYHINDVVILSGSAYIALTAHTGTQPEAAGNADWSLFASGGDIADQTGQTGKVLSTDGTSTSWVSGNPDQSGNSGKVLKTDGSSTSWGNITVTELGVTDGTDGQVLSTNGGGIWSFVDQQGGSSDFGEPQTFSTSCRWYSSANCTCVPSSATTMMIEAWGQGGGGGGSCCCQWGKVGGQGGDYSMKKWDVSSYGNITVCGCACCCECNAVGCCGHQGQFTRYCICGTGGGSSTDALQCCYCTSGGCGGHNSCHWGQSNGCCCHGGRAYYDGQGSNAQGPGRRGGADCNWVCDNFCTSGGAGCEWIKCESTNPGCNTVGCCFYDLYVKGRCGSTPTGYTCSNTKAWMLGIGGASFKGGAEQDQTCNMNDWAYCGMCGNFPGGGGHGAGSCGGACCMGGRGHQGAWIVSWE
jgi:hypothetical protein